MQRRDISVGLLVAGAALVNQRAEAQTCTAPCYTRTAAEIAAGVTPTNTAYTTVPYDVRRYGATGSGTTDDTVALSNALLVASHEIHGACVFLPRGKYKITSPLNVPNYVRLLGEGKLETTLLPVGAFNACVQVIGASYASWGVARAVEKIEIDGSGGFTGVGLWCQYLGLRCYFADLYIHNCSGKGVYIEGCFDHNYDRIESRGNSSYGIHMYEKQTSPDGVYEELSKLVFYDCWAIENNDGGEQWRVDGGDTCSFLECKPSEGSIGLGFERNCFGHRVSHLMYDQITSPGTGSAILTNADWVQGLFIDGVETFQAQYAVLVNRGRNIHIEHVFQASGGAGVGVAATATGSVFLGEGISYADARTAPQTYPRNYQGVWTPIFYGSGSTVGNGTLVANYLLDGNDFSFDLQFTVGSSTIVGTGAGFSLPFSAVRLTALTSMGVQQSTSSHYTLNTFVPAGNIILVGTGTGYLSATSPFTWAAGDLLTISGAFRIA